MTPNDMEVGKNYFCHYEAEVSADSVPLLAGQAKDIPKTLINGIGQVLQRDPENQLCEVIDLQSHQRYVVSYSQMSEIAEVE